MTKTDGTKSDELSVTASGVTIKGELVEAIGKPIKRLAGTADSVLRLVNNVVALPLDYFSSNLEGFRRKFAEKFDEIPHESRIEPPLRIGYAVLQHASNSANEEEIQELFAQLLASASNADDAAKVHPGFSTVIGELHATDAKVLRSIASHTRPGEPIMVGPFSGLDADPATQSRARGNLMRLGLLERRDSAYSPQELHRFVGKSHYDIPSSPRQAERTFLELVNDLQRLKNELIKQLSQQHHKQALYISSFGQDFIDVVLK